MSDLSVWDYFALYMGTFFVGIFATFYFDAVPLGLTLTTIAIFIVSGFIAYDILREKPRSKIGENHA